VTFIKKIINLVVNFVLGGVSFFTAIRFWLLDLNTIDYITGVCLMIIAIIGAGKFLVGWKIPFIDNFPFITKAFNSVRTRPERYMKMVEKGDFSIIYLFIQFIERIVKTMRNIIKIIIGWLTFVFKLNPKTSGANAAVIGLYYAIVRELFTRYGLMNATVEILLKQDGEFYKWLGLYTVGLIVALLGVNSIGWEDIQKWTSRVNFRKLTKLRDDLIKLDVKLNTDIVEMSLNKAYTLLALVKLFIREEEYVKIKNLLDDMEYKLAMYEADETLKAEEARQKRLKEAEQRRQQLGNQERQEQPSEQDSKYRINR